MKKLRVTAFLTLALAGLLFGCNLNTGALLEGSPTSEGEPLAEPTENGQERIPALPRVAMWKR